MSSYCAALVNTFVSLGLLLLYTAYYRAYNWDPPYRAPKIVVILFFLSNIFLIVVPLIPPAPGSRTYEHLPYWVSLFLHTSSMSHVHVCSDRRDVTCRSAGISRNDTLDLINYFFFPGHPQSHAIVAISVSIIGVVYWFVWAVWLPRRNGYKLVRVWVLQADGVSRCIYKKAPVQ